jgi:hypothetical protein
LRKCCEAIRRLATGSVGTTAARPSTRPQAAPSEPNNARRDNDRRHRGNAHQPETRRSAAPRTDPGQSPQPERSAAIARCTAPGYRRCRSAAGVSGGCGRSRPRRSAAGGHRRARSRIRPARARRRRRPGRQSGRREARQKRPAGRPPRAVVLIESRCPVGIVGSRICIGSSRVVVGWVGGGPACCARRAVRLICAALVVPQDDGSTWGAAVWDRALQAPGTGGLLTVNPPSCDHRSGSSAGRSRRRRTDRCCR